MNENNDYAVRGTMCLLQRGDITIEQTVEIINMWIELTAKKFYAEGELDGRRSNTKKPAERDTEAHQRLCDMGIR